MSLVKASSLAFLAPAGGGPRIVRFGATLSSPKPREPNRKNSASRYSKFRGNSRRLTSLPGTSEAPSDVSRKQHDLGRTKKRKRKSVTKIAGSSIFGVLQRFLLGGCLRSWSIPRLSVSDYIHNHTQREMEDENTRVRSQQVVGRRFRSTEARRVCFAWKCGF